MKHLLIKQFNKINKTILIKAQQVKIMIFDVDGVLTDGSLLYSFTGEKIKRFNVLDGYGINLIQSYGITTAIISARKSSIVLKRAKDLNINYVYQGVHKCIAFEKLLFKTNLMAINAGYMGDDVIDLPILCQAGFSASVANGHATVKTQVDYITKAVGGYGAAREVCDLLLYAQRIIK